MNVYGFDKAEVGPLILRDRPAHQYGIQRQTDGRWYYPSDEGTHRDDFWKLFPFHTYTSALDAAQQVRVLERRGWNVKIVPLKGGRK
ncbi:MAG: hypothetical protein ACYDCO_01875 [Armatimonadota bacterium]